MGIDNENLEMIELLLEFKVMKDIFYDAFHTTFVEVTDRPMNL